MGQDLHRNVVGPKIRRLRYSRNMTQEMLSARCHLAGCKMSRGTLAKIEAQLRGVTDTELFVIALVLKAKMEDLFPVHFAKELKTRRKQ